MSDTPNSKNLLVVSNHPPEKWGPEQRRGWDDIVYHPFPLVDPAMPVCDTIQYILYTIAQVTGWRIVRPWHEEEPHAPDAVFVMYRDDPWYVCCQGEFSVTAGVAQAFSLAPNRLVFPTTRRIVEERDGVKTSKFEFVAWRTAGGKIISLNQGGGK